MDNVIVIDWIKCMWQCCPDALLKLTIIGILIMGTFYGHVTDDVEKRFREDKSQQTCVPSGIAFLFQSLNICMLNAFQSSFKIFLFGVDGDCSSQNESCRKTKNPTLTLIYK